MREIQTLRSKNFGLSDTDLLEKEPEGTLITRADCLGGTVRSLDVKCQITEGAQYSTRYRDLDPLRTRPTEDKIA